MTKLLVSCYWLEHRTSHGSWHWSNAITLQPKSTVWVTVGTSIRRPIKACIQLIMEFSYTKVFTIFGQKYISAFIFSFRWNLLSPVCFQSSSYSPLFPSCLKFQYNACATKMPYQFPPSNCKFCRKKILKVVQVTQCTKTMYATQMIVLSFA